MTTLGNEIGNITRPVEHALGGLLGGFLKLFSGNEAVPSAAAPETQAAATAVTTAQSQLQAAAQQAETAAEQVLQEGATTLANDILAKIPLIGTMLEGPVDAEIAQAFPALWAEVGNVIMGKLTGAAQPAASAA